LDFNIAKNLNFRRSNFINDANIKVDGSYFISPKSSLKFGTKQTYFIFEPGRRVPITSESIVSAATLPQKKAFEQAYYVSHILKIGSRATVEYGGRISVFSNIGDGRSINYIGGNPTIIDNGFIKEAPKDTNNKYTNYSSGEVYNTFVGFEPRFNLTYLLDASSSVKLSYNRMFQYMHLIQNISASTGQEFWTPSDKYIKPQMADQVAAGYFKNFNNNIIEASVEVYYKQIKNTVEIRDGADLQFNEATEAQVVSGQGRAYGVEFFVRKQRGTTTGWVGYTLAKSERQADNVNNGEWYAFRFDRRHYLTVVVNQELSKRVSFGGSFIYATGEAFTIASQRYSLFEGNEVSIDYSKRNGARFPAYHRLDLSLTINQKKTEANPLWLLKKRPYEGSWVFSLYNAYGRKNAYTITYKNNDQGVPTAYKSYLFTFVPAVTYNFKF
jgi:hypothetical protein